MKRVWQQHEGSPYRINNMDDFSQYSDKMLAENYRSKQVEMIKIYKELQKRKYDMSGHILIDGIYCNRFEKVTKEVI